MATQVKTRMAAVLAAALMALAMVPLFAGTALAENEPTEAQQIVWGCDNKTLYLSDKVVSGKCENGIKPEDQCDQQWDSYRNNITSVQLLGDIYPKYTVGWFKGCSKLERIEGIEHLHTDYVEEMSRMFVGCTSLKTLDLSRFDMSNVTDVANMFNGCASLTTIKVKCTTDLSQIAPTQDMFLGCDSLVGGNGTAYNIDKADSTYARPDGLDGKPGYFTAVHDTDQSNTYQAATLSDDGWFEANCATCNRQVSYVIPHPETFTLSKKTFTFDGKEKKPSVTVKAANGKEIASSNYAVKYEKNKNAGKATATVIFAIPEYTGTKSIDFTIDKAANPLKVKGKKASVKFSGSKNRKLAVSKVVKATKAGKGKLTYKKAKGNKKITIAKNGKVTVKKGLKKGAYKVTAKVQAAGNENYKKSAWKKFTFTVTVK